MASGNLLSQGVYSPLPQSLSDSDSEKDIPMRPKYPTGFVVGGKKTGVGMVGSGVAAKAKHLLENGTRGASGGLNGSTEYFVMPPAKGAPIGGGGPMSAGRRVCFALSILLCVATVSTFLWALPCSESGTCPTRVSNWENQHEGIELTGQMNAVRSTFGSTRNLVLFFRGSLDVPAESHSGIISVLGTDGSVAWYVVLAQSRPPLDLDCNLLDASGDEALDCVVLGADRSLEAIDSLSGTVLWHASESNFSFPLVVLQDLNKDGINELLGVRNGNKFVVLSGKNGKIIGETVVPGCDDIRVTKSNSSYVFGTCGNKNDTQFSLDEIINSALLKSPPVKTMPWIPPPLADTSTPDRIVLNDKILSIRNHGTCPQSCRVEVVLHEASHGEQKIASWLYQNTYVFTPVKFTFKQTGSSFSSLKGHVNGFILKMWQWYSYLGNQAKWKSSAAANETKNGTIQINTIMERIVLITFNTTNFHVINASLVEITQLCFANKVCQPSLANQNTSLFVTDLDADHSQELVSYSSTYAAKSEPDGGWQLVSNMKVIRLEAELPKLYDTAK